MSVPPPSLLTGYDHDRAQMNMNPAGMRWHGGWAGGWAQALPAGAGPGEELAVLGSGGQSLLPQGNLPPHLRKGEGMAQVPGSATRWAVCVAGSALPAHSQEAPRAAGCHQASQGQQGRAPCAEGGALSRAEPCWGEGSTDTAEGQTPRGPVPVDGQLSVRRAQHSGFIPSALPCSSRPSSLSLEESVDKGRTDQNKVQQELPRLHLMGTVRALRAEQPPAAARSKQKGLTADLSLLLYTFP